MPGKWIIPCTFSTFGGNMGSFVLHIMYGWRGGAAGIWGDGGRWGSGTPSDPLTMHPIALRCKAVQHPVALAAPHPYDDTSDALQGALQCACDGIAMQGGGGDLFTQRFPDV